MWSIVNSSLTLFCKQYGFQVPDIANFPQSLHKSPLGFLEHAQCDLIFHGVTVSNLFFYQAFFNALQ